MPQAVLMVGEDPSKVDFSDPSIGPGMSADKVMAGLNGSVDELKASGIDAELCLVDLGQTAEAVLSERLRARRYDCVVVGAGLRVVPRHALLFETLINVLHREAGGARIAFNDKPDNSAEAARRQLSGGKIPMPS